MKKTQNVVLLTAFVGAINCLLESTETTKSTHTKSHAVLTMLASKRFNGSWNKEEHAEFYDYFKRELNIPYMVAELIGVYAYQTTCFVYDNRLGEVDGGCYPRALVMLSNNQDLALGGQDGLIRIWNIEHKKQIDSIDAHAFSVTSLLQLRNGWLASGSSDTTIGLWDLTGSNWTHKLRGHRGKVSDLLQLSSGNLVSASKDATIMIWDPLTGNCLNILKNGLDRVMKLTIMPNNSIVAISYSNIIMWNPDTREHQNLGHYHGYRLDALVLSDGTFVSSDHDKSVIKFWDLQKNKRIAKIAVPRGPNVLAYLADQDRLLVGCDEGIVVVINTIIQKIVWMFTIRKPMCYDGSIHGIAVLPHGRFIVSCCDGTLYSFSSKIPEIAIPEVAEKERHCIMH
jgi:WD40 repeat protein